MTKVVTPKKTPKATEHDDPRIVWTGKGKEIPAREGSGKHKRISFVQANSGKKQSEILSRKVARKSTIAFCLKHGLAKKAAMLALATTMLAPVAGRAATLTTFDLSVGPFAAAYCPAGSCGQVTMDDALNFSVTLAGSNLAINDGYLTVANGGVVAPIGANYLVHPLGSYNVSWTIPGFGSDTFGSFGSAFTCLSDCGDPLSFSTTDDLVSRLWSDTTLWLVLHLHFVSENFDRYVGAQLSSLVNTDPPALSETPLPAALWLFGSVLGLGAAGVVAGRRRKAVARA